MPDELKSSEVNQYDQEVKKTKDLPSLEQSLTALGIVGGFDFLQEVIDGAVNLIPNKPRTEIFLSESSYKQQRKDLKQKMNLWIDLLSNANTVSDMIDKSVERANTSERLLKNNVKKTLGKTRKLEESYRSVHLFFKNTEETKLKNVAVMNASLEQLTDLDTPKFRNHVARELKQNYDRLDMRENYSLLVIPGYLKNNKTIEEWAKIAYNNKVMLVTDFVNLDTPEDVIEMFRNANITSSDPHMANAVMTCNYIAARGRKTEFDEEKDLYVPGSAALAGKMYRTKLSQPVAGYTYGNIDEVTAVKFSTLKSDISAIDNIGLIPMVSEWGRVMGFSDKTLFTGENIGMQTYSVVRVFDFIAKVLSDFLNRNAFQLWNTGNEKNLRNQIVKFLEGIQGADKLIEKFQIIRFDQDQDQKNRIFIDIHITPYFPAKSFLVKLDGYKGDDGEEWKAELKEPNNKK